MVFVDLYAGSGAAGIEALSRGASIAIFVERDRHALDSIARNLKATGLEDLAIVVRASADAWLASAGRHELSGRPARTVFLDPPYDAPGELDRSLEAVDAAGHDGILARGGAVVAKHFSKQEPAPTRLLRSVRQERFGETMLTFFHWADEVDA
jgi:16S rRNA (guanine966-N2)-methyltransferase